MVTFYVSIAILRRLEPYRDDYRDKDTDSTWLFGPWKKFTGPKSFMTSATQATGRTSESLLYQKSSRNRCLSFGGRHKSILNLPRHQVCYGLDHLRIFWLMDNQVKPIGASSFRRKITRVRFNPRVQQAFCLPQDTSWYLDLWQQLQSKYITVPRDHLDLINSLFEAHKCGQRLLSLPPADLNTHGDICYGEEDELAMLVPIAQ